MSDPHLPQGRLIVDPSVFLAPGAIVCGDVRIGAGASVWFHAVIRGDSDAIQIGEHSNVIGMGSIVLSGARIGAGSLVGAGALVRERQVIPPGSLVLGAPARVAGEVQPAHRDAIARGAAYYGTLARDYLAKGFGQPLPPPGGAAHGGAASR